MTEQFSTPAPEAKNAGTQNVAEAFNDFMQAFDEFRQNNDDRIRPNGRTHQARVV